MAKLFIALACLLLSGATHAASDDCTSIQNSTTGGVTEFSLLSHKGHGSGSAHAPNMKCTWSVNASAGDSTWRVTFHQINLEASGTGLCRYDNLTVSYMINSVAFKKVFCGNQSDLTLLTNDSFRLDFKSDGSDNNEGFRITWRSISRADAASQMGDMSPIFLVEDRGDSRCSSIETVARNMPLGDRAYNGVRLHMSGSSYLHNADCSWNIDAPSGKAVYMTFDSIQLELNPTCSLDSVTVTYRLPGRSQNQSRTLCNTRPGLTLVSLDKVTLRLRTDPNLGSGFSVKWFVAPFYLSSSSDFETSSEFKEESCPELESGSNGGKIRLYYEPPQTYPSRMRCSWAVPVPDGKMASFSFSKFQLARSSFRPWRRYNYSYTAPGSEEYCSYREDAVRIQFKEVWTRIRRSKSFCFHSNIHLQQTVLSEVDTVTVFFNSNEYRNSHGFVLEYTLTDATTPRPATCPTVQQLDSDRQQIAPSDQMFMYGRQTCSWILQPMDQSHMISLMLNLYTRMDRNPYYSNYEFYGPGPVYYPDYSERRLSYCNPMVTVTSKSYVDDRALPSVGDASVSMEFRREYCPMVANVSLGLFAGDVNVSVSGLGLSLKGFSVMTTQIPKPRKGCSSINITTEHYKSSAVKVFSIVGKAGCVTSEILVDQSSTFMNTNITIQVLCKTLASNELFTVIQETAMTTVKCGSTKSVTNFTTKPAILKFPATTDATVTFRVTHGFRVMGAACQRLNSQSAANSTIGSFLLPLYFDPYDGDMRYYYGMYGMPSLVSCSYDLAYRPGYSIWLRISHNLDYDYLDEFCHLKTRDRRVNPHIVLTVSQRDPNYPDTWIEQQQEMCHGLSVGSLGLVSDMLIDGSLSISLLALTGRQRSAANSTAAAMAMSLFNIINATMPQRLQFLIGYEYVPSCPELTCRDKKGQRGGCLAGRMSDIQLEANLMANVAGQNCKLSIGSSRALRSVVARLSGIWLATVEVAGFTVSCPCHNCGTDSAQEFITVGQKGSSTDPGSEKFVVCGDYANSTKAVTLPIGSGNSDVQVSYKLFTAGATVRIAFIDCQLNSELKSCKIQELLQNFSLRKAGTNAHGGLLFAAILLAAILIGCLLFLNRHSLMRGLNRLRGTARPPRVVGSRTDDTLQLTQESAEGM